MDADLLKKLVELRDGVGERKPSDALILAEALKQLAVENEELKEEVEDIEEFTVQFEYTDADYKYWVKVGEGSVDYGEGEAEDPAATMKAAGVTWAGLGSGELEATSAYMSGELQIEGDLQAAITYGEINGMMRDILEDLSG
ncbi:MAG: SCP2 sterol-binding domain-containing protein [Candidatus Hermodarchaeota archaeon]